MQSTPSVPVPFLCQHAVAASFCQPEPTVDDDGDFECTPKEAVADIVSLSVSLKRRGKRITATRVCQVWFWATKAHIEGPAHLLSLRPDAHSEKFSRKFDEYGGSPEDKANNYNVCPLV